MTTRPSSPDALIDLHMHSTASDGTLSPSELVAHAKAEGLSAIALTDHDTTAGLSEALEAGERLGVEVIPGIEISARRERGTLHIVGLFIEPGDPTLRERCEALQAERARRNEKIVARLCKLGMPITLDDVRAESGGGVLGRPHFAAVLVKRGHVADHQEAFDKWLAKGRPAYFPKALFDPAESIGMIHDAGGVAIVAHPSQLKCESEKDLDAAIAELRGHGVDGIEIQWSTATDDEMALARQLAERHGLLESGGSDFHGGPKPDVRIGVGRGQVRLTADLLEPLRRAAERHR